MTVSLIEVLFRGLMVGVAASITVGPVAVLCIQRTLSQRRRSGIIAGVMVGVYVSTQNPVPQIRRNRAGRTSLWQDFASIFGLTIANFIMVIPYILAFFAVFEISSNDITGSGFAGFLRAVLTIGGFFGGAVAWWTFVAFVINLFRRRFRPRHMLTINRVAGLIIGVLGIYTILSTFFDIFPNVGY